MAILETGGYSSYVSLISETLLTLSVCSGSIVEIPLIWMGVFSCGFSFSLLKEKAVWRSTLHLRQLAKYLTAIL